MFWANMAVLSLRDGVQPLTAAACRDVAGKPRMHEWTRSAQSTVEWLQALIKLIVSLREPKFSLCSCCFLLASISTTLARTKLTRLVLSLPEESHAEHHCCASDDASLGPQAWLCLVSKLHTARDSLTINLLHVDTADSFLLHGGSE